jgi:hypothetical protein
MRTLAVAAIASLTNASPIPGEIILAVEGLKGRPIGRR